MKVFLDTNVLASAAATRGLCADVVREVFARHESIVSKQVLGELRRVLQSKFRFPRVLAADYVELVRQDSTLAEPARLPKIKLRDKEDLRILAAAAAVAAEADVLVTGDAELLALGHCDKVEILSPRQFWERLIARRPTRN